MTAAAKVLEDPVLREEDAVRLRQAVMRLSRRLRRAGLDEGFTATQSGVLATLNRSGEMRATELADAESLNPTMLSRVLATLEADGWVARAPAVEDRRATMVKIKPAGKKLMQRLRSRRTALLLQWGEDLSPHEVDRLIAALPALESLAGLSGDIK